MMKKISFKEIIDGVPLEIRGKYELLKIMRERPDFHPEESVAEHIRIVTERCIFTGDPDLKYKIQ